MRLSTSVEHEARHEGGAWGSRRGLSKGLSMGVCVRHSARGAGLGTGDTVVLSLSKDGLQTPEACFDKLSTRVEHGAQHERGA